MTQTTTTGGGWDEEADGEGCVPDTRIRSIHQALPLHVVLLAVANHHHGADQRPSHREQHEAIIVFVEGNNNGGNPSRELPTRRKLEEYPQSSWDSVLHFLVGSDDNDRCGDGNNDVVGSGGVNEVSFYPTRVAVNLIDSNEKATAGVGGGGGGGGGMRRMAARTVRAPPRRVPSRRRLPSHAPIRPGGRLFPPMCGIRLCCGIGSVGAW